MYMAAFLSFETAVHNTAQSEQNMVGIVIVFRKKQILQFLGVVGTGK